MRSDEFRDWLARVDALGAAQRREALAVLSGRSASSASVAAVEPGVDEERRCPRCRATGAVSTGRARGLRRYRCKGCGRTFNAATGAPLSGWRRKERWLSFGASLSDGETVRASAARCGVAVSTAFRWRHRFLRAVEKTPQQLRGIVEADETFVLRSRKGARKLDRKPRRRGGKATERGLSREQVPVHVAADRGGGNASAAPPAMSAATLGVRHEALDMSAGERVRDAFHIQTVNNRHGRLKGFLRGFRGIATKYLDSYLRWFHLIGLAAHASPRACLSAAMNTAYIRFAN